MGDFLNPRFVCLKIDAEKGEGKTLAKRYGITSYPTFLVVDTMGQEIGRKVSGGSIPGFIAAIERLIDPEKSPERLKERYDNGERSADLIEAYAIFLKEKAYKDRKYDRDMLAYVNAMVKDYYAGLNDVERLKVENLFVYIDYTQSLTDESTRFMINHQNDFPAEISDRIHRRVKGVYVDEINNYFSGKRNYNASVYRELEDYVESMNSDEKRNYELLLRFIEKHEAGNYKTYLSFCARKYKALPEYARLRLIESLPILVCTDDCSVLQLADHFVRFQLKDMSTNEISFAVKTIKILEAKINNTESR